MPSSGARLSHAAKWFEAPVRWIASRSYALYIIHLTILVDIAETRLFEPGLLPALGCTVLAVALPFGLAELSYRFLEAPILMWRPRQDRANARISMVFDRRTVILASAAK